MFIAAILAAGAPAHALACSGSLHIEVEQSGVYALGYAEIAAQQPALADCTAGDLLLTNRGAEIPLRIVAAADGGFADGARIEWVGEALHGPASWNDAYSRVNVYILSAAAGVHRRLQAGTATGAASGAALVRRLHFERDNQLIRLNNQRMKPGEEPDFWHWAKLTHADPKPFSFEFDLPDLRVRAADRKATIPATLIVRGISRVLPHENVPKPDDHVLEVALNGKPVAVLRWDGLDESRPQVALPLALLRANGNELTLHVPTRFAPGNMKNPIVDVIMFDSADVSYPIDGNVGSAAAPFEVSANAPARIELRKDDAEPLALYAADGHFYPGEPLAAGRYRFDGVAPRTALYPVASTRFLQPTRVRAVAAGDWRHAYPGYDYLIISHASLIDAVRPLAEFHRQHGLRVALIDADEIYDQFNGGISHPAAIRDLIAWGRAHWATKPRYVLLVGTASFDIRTSGQPVSMQPPSFDPRTGTPFAKRQDRPAAANSATGAPNRNLIPTWQYPSEEGQSASDNGYVARTERDFHPALAIGRFPVVTPDEAAAIVRKTIAYANAPTLGAWRSKVMFIANEDTSFQDASDRIAEDMARQGFGAEKIYGRASEKDNLAHQAEINEGLNTGDLLVHFLGHGGRFIWRTGPPDFRKNHDLFTLDDVGRLRNGARLPMVLSMTCFSAPFDNPGEDSIGERFLREPDKGAVAVFAASWSNSPSADFSRKLVEQLIKPGQAIGDAIVAAKGQISSRTMVEMYNLLGDPALVLERPREALDIVRRKERWRDAVAVRVREPGFGGEITVRWLDASANVVQSRTYESRDSQFELAVPSPAPAEVQVYAANFRTGRDALGTLDLRPTPPARPAPPPLPPPTMLSPSTNAAARGKAAQPPPLPPEVAALVAKARARMVVDRLSRSGFEAPAVAAGPVAAQPAAHSGTAVAVEPRPRKSKPQQ